MPNEYILQLLKDRYFLKNETSWDQLAKRVSALYPDIYEYIRDQVFIPGTPTLLNANTNGERRGTLSSCFPMEIKDSIIGIFDSLRDAAITTKLGGGVGWDFSTLRSSNEMVSSISRHSSGPLPFMDIFSAMLNAIQQGGVRRGAGMGLFDIRHPNILDVIKAKDQPGRLERMNLSIQIDSEFYKQLETMPDTPHRVHNKADDKIYDLQDKTGAIITAKQIWDLIVHYAWLNAEPGIFNSTIAFDRCVNTNVSKVVITNPCGEFVNVINTACCLASVNLLKFVKDNSFDWKMYDTVISKAVNFLNNVIDQNIYPIEGIRETTLKVRPIGLGVMGLGDLFYALGMPYNSKQAIDMSEELIRYLTLRGMVQSVELARQNKKSYDSFDYDLFMKCNERLFTKDCREIKIKELKKSIRDYGIYNSSITSIAPTGSISTICETTGGIEPAFALSYIRKVERLNGKYDKMYIVDKVFSKYLDKYGEKKQSILDEIIENKGSCQKCKSIPEEDKKVFVVASDLTSMEHLDILSAVCNVTSLSVSKTVNLPSTATEEEVSKLYLEAHKRGVIGVTVYREGSREGILVTEQKKEEELKRIVKNNAPKRPQQLPCDIYHVKVNKKLDKLRQIEYIVVIGLLYGDPYEIFVFENGKLDKKYVQGVLTKKARGKYNIGFEDGSVCEDIMKEQTEEEECITRMASTALRHGADIHFVVHQLEKIRGEHISTFTQVMARVLKKYVKDGVRVSGEVCPECEKKGLKGNLVRESGCISCKDCGWSKC